MDDRKLHSLLVVLNCGSMSAAADKLNCTQSAVTQMMNSLESELGFAVLQRTNHGIALTEAGKRILPFIKEANDALFSLEKESKRILSNDKPVIKIGTHASMSSTLIFDVITSYQKSHPDIKFEIIISAKTLGTDLKQKNIDISIGNEMYFHGFSYTPIMEDDIVAAIPESYKTNDEEYITRSELNKYNILRSPVNPVFNDNYRGNIFNEPYDNETYIYTEDDSLILRMVSAGQGVTILPGLSIQNLPRGVKIRKLYPPMKRRIVVALPKRPSPAVQLFAKYVIKIFTNKDVSSN